MTRIDDRVIGNGKPGPVTQKLLEGYRQRALALTRGPPAGRPASRTRLRLSHKFAQVPPQMTLGFSRSPSPAPVRFEADGARVSVALQRGDLPPPVHVHLAERPPGRRVPLTTQSFACTWATRAAGSLRIAVGKRRFPEDEGVGRIPDRLERRMIEGRQDPARFRAGGDVAGMLVLEPDDQPALRRLVRQLTQRGDDPVVALAPARSSASRRRRG